MKTVAPAALVMLVALAACRQNMDEQPKLKPYAAAEAFSQDQAARPLPAGTVPHGAAASDDTQRPPVDMTLLRRGQERYGIFCTPCHGLAGYGNGMVVERGFPHPPSLHSAELRKASAQHIFDVITNGHGVMYSYADRVPPHDRWAIAAYVRALQLSQAGGGTTGEGGS